MDEAVAAVGPADVAQPPVAAGLAAEARAVLAAAAEAAVPAAEPGAAALAPAAVAVRTQRPLRPTRLRITK